MTSGAINIAIFGALIGIAVFYATRGIRASVGAYFRNRYPHQEMWTFGPFVGWDPVKVARVQLFLERLDRYFGPIWYAFAFALLFSMFRWSAR